MKIPHRFTVKYRIGELLHRNPGSDVEQVVKGMCGQRGNYIRCCVSEMISAGLLVQSNGLIKCSAEFQLHLDHMTEEMEQAPKIDLVPPRTAPAFKPLSEKFMLPKVPPRDDAEPLREIYFKVGSIGFCAGYQV